MDYQKFLTDIPDVPGIPPEVMGLIIQFVSNKQQEDAQRRAEDVQRWNKHEEQDKKIRAENLALREREVAAQERLAAAMTRIADAFSFKDPYKDLFADGSVARIAQAMEFRNEERVR